MKTFRLFAALLVVALLPMPGFSQESGEVAALLAKARKGNGIAQYNLGLAYAEGKGVAADPVEAYVWLSLARENGARGRALDNLLGALDKNALEQAQRRLNERKTELNAIRPPPIGSPRPAPPTPAATAPAKAAAPVAAVQSTPPPAPVPAVETPADPAALAAEVTALRADRERLTTLAAQHEKAAHEAETKVIDLNRTADATKGELTRVRMALTAAQKAASAKPAAPAYPDLSGRVTELETAYTAASTTLAQAQAALASASAKPAAPTYPDLSGKVAELTAQLAAKPAAPAAPSYPDLSGKVAELQAALASKPAAPSYPDLSGKVGELEAALASANASLKAKPAASPDTAALAQKTRELQAAVADLEEARTFGRKVEDTLNKVNDDKARVAAAAAAELAEARAFGSQVENTLNKVSDEKAALESSLRTATAQLAAVKSASPTAPSAPAYPDLSGKVADLQAQLARQSSDLSAATAAKAEAVAQVAVLAAKPAPPAYPDLSGKVAQLEAQVSSDLSAVASAKAETARAKQEVVALTKAKDDATAQVALANAALKAKPAAPSYPDLSGKVAELQAALAAKPAAPAYPDLSSKVAEQQAQLAKLSSDLSAAATSKADADKQVAALAKAKDEAQAALAAKPSAPAYPDLSGRVAELEKAYTASSTSLAQAQAALAAKPSAPAYPDLSSKVAQLEAQVSSDLSSIASAKEEASHAKQEVAALIKAKEDKPAAPAYPDLSGKVAQLERDLTTARAAAPAYPDLSGRVAELTAQLAAKPAAPAYPDLSGKVAELQAALAVKPAAPAAPAYPNLAAKVTELETALAATSQKASAAELGRTNVAKEFDEYKSATAAAQRERTTLLANVKLLESDKVSLRRQAENAGTESMQLRTQVSTLKEQLAAKPAAPTYPDLSGKVAELTAQLAAKPAAPAFPDLRSRVSSLEADLTTAKQLLAAKPAAPTYPDLSAKVAELETTVRDSTRLVASASAEADRAKREIAQLNQALAEKPKAVEPSYPDYTNLVKEMTAEVGKMRGDRDRQAGELAAGARRVQELENQVGSLQAAVAAKPAAPAFPDLREQVAQLERDLTAARAAKPAYPNLAGRVAELEAALAAKSAAPVYPNLTGRVSELETQLARVSSDLSATAAAKTEAQAALAAKPAAPVYPDLRDRVGQLERDLLSARTTAPTYPDLTGRVTDLESQLTRTSNDLSAAAAGKAEALAQVAALTKAKAREPSTPAYPNLAGRVAELEAALAAKPAAAAAPTYPDLSGRVTELTAALAASENASKVKSDYVVDLEGKLRKQAATVQEANKAKVTADALTSEVTQLREDRERLQKMIADTGRKLRDSSADATRIKELETQATGLQASLATAQAKTGELQTALAAKPAAPTYPDLSGKVSELQAALAAKPAAPTYPDLSGKVAEQQAQLAKLATDLTSAATAKTEADKQIAALTKAKEARSEPITAGSPTFPNLSVRVRELETQLAAANAAAAKNRTPAYPDLTGQVSELKGQLATATTDAQARGQQLADLSKSSEAARQNQSRELDATKAALAKANASLSAKPAAPAYPDLTGRVAELEKAYTEASTNLAQAQAALTAKPAAPAYPNLSGKVSELQAALAAKPAAPVYPDLRSRVSDLETRLATTEKSLAAKPAAPTYPDLSGKVAEQQAQLAKLSSDLTSAATAKTESDRQIAALTKANAAHSEPITAGSPTFPNLSVRVRELEAQLATANAAAAAKNRAPAYPDLSGRVSELETSLASTRRDLGDAQTRLASAASQPVASAPASTADTSDLQKRLTETEDRLATALRGYALLEKERDSLQAKSGQASDALAAKVATLTTQVEQLQTSSTSAQAENARLGDAFAALQRSTGQAAGDAASARALVQQLQGANSVLAQENYQLKTMLSRPTGGSTPVATAAVMTSPPAARIHVVASGDSLSKLSQRYYGTAGRWQEIYNANQALLGPNGVLRVGTSLRIP